MLEQVDILKRAISSISDQATLVHSADGRWRSKTRAGRGWNVRVREDEEEWKNGERNDGSWIRGVGVRDMSVDRAIRKPIGLGKVIRE